MIILFYLKSFFESVNVGNFYISLARPVYSTLCHISDCSLLCKCVFSTTLSMFSLTWWFSWSRLTIMMNIPMAINPNIETPIRSTTLTTGDEALCFVTSSTKNVSNQLRTQHFVICLELRSHLNGHIASISMQEWFFVRPHCSSFITLSFIKFKYI